MTNVENATVQVRKRGVLTFPKKFRDAYGIEEGDALNLVDLGGGMFVVTRMMPAVPGLVEEIEKIRLNEDLSVESLLDGLREEREKLTREMYSEKP